MLEYPPCFLNTGSTPIVNAVREIFKYLVVWVDGEAAMFLVEGQ